jgi:hypothetical protein
MKVRVSLLISAAFLCTSVIAQQQPPAAAPAAAQGQSAQGQAPQGPPLRVFIYGGLKSHGEGQHDYPQFLADWSKLLTARSSTARCTSPRPANWPPLTSSSFTKVTPAT